MDLHGRAPRLLILRMTMMHWMSESEFTSALLIAYARANPGKINFASPGV
jgi:hypothetical protein